MKTYLTKANSFYIIALCAIISAANFLACEVPTTEFGFNPDKLGQPGDCPSNSVELSANMWTNGSTAATGLANASRSWYVFTATAELQYIHFNPGELNNVNVQLYNSVCRTDNAVYNLRANYLSASFDLTIGETYYIKITPWSPYLGGDYQIGFNTSNTPPTETNTGDGGDNGGGNNNGGGGDVVDAHGYFTDLRDGQRYRAVRMPDGKLWMAENLNFATEIGSWCYGEDGYVPSDDGNGTTLTPAEIQTNCERYGRLYDWAAAMGLDSSYNNRQWAGSEENHQGVCPSGWRLSSDNDWETLRETIGDSLTAAKKLSSITGWNYHSDGSCNGTDDFGFNALPAGLRNMPYRDNPVFFGIAEYTGYWWTTRNIVGTSAYSWYIDGCGLGLGQQSPGKTYGFSVRCVRD